MYVRKGNKVYMMMMMMMMMIIAFKLIMRSSNKQNS